MTDKLFKTPVDLTNFDEYVKYIDEGLISLGFGERGDEVFYRVRSFLFLSLYHMVKECGPSFDIEIYFTSLISDLNEAFDTVGPSLLKIQRNTQAEPQEPEQGVSIEAQEFVESLIENGKS